MRTLRLLAFSPVSPHFVSFAWRYHLNPALLLPLCRALSGTSTPPPKKHAHDGGPGISVLPVTLLRLTKGWGRQVLPSSWTTLFRICPALRPRRARCCQATTAARCFPRVRNGEGSLPSHVHFRGSMTRLLRSLSTLHKPDHPDPCKTRFRLLATLCRAGLATCRAISKGFLLIHLLYSSFPRLGLARYVLYNIWSIRIF